MDPHQPFDLATRRARRQRHGGSRWLDPVWSSAREELLAREQLAGGAPDGPVVELSGRPGAQAPGEEERAVLRLDPAATRLARVGAAGGRAVADEAMLPLAGGRAARVRMLGGLEGVNDLPGALLLARRALQPGGWFSAAVAGGETLAELRRAFVAADDLRGGVRARVGPTLDPAEAGGLLQRAGLERPVVDVERLTLPEASLTELACALRQEGLTGWLAARPRGLTSPGRWAEASARLGRVRVGLTLLYLIGRAPG